MYLRFGGKAVLFRRVVDDTFAGGDDAAGLFRVDVDWVAETTGLLAAADTYLLIQATLPWTPDQLRSWLYRTWMHLATTPSPA